MTKWESDKAYRHWLYQAVGMGNRGLLRKLTSDCTPAEIYETAKKRCLDKMLSTRYQAKANQIEAFTENYDVTAEYEKLIERGISFVTVNEEGYPKKLVDIPDPPWAIYYVGKLPSDKEMSIAVIGARNCSEYGKAMARQFGEILAGGGIQIVSGMARGIDGIGQQAALEAGGYSLAVLGCGVDICYPPENRQLYEKLIAEGGICSEYPPGIEPRSILFPPRNRIISGMCDGVLVIEAKERSGTLITVDMALEQGRDVYALPGRITDPLSSGCNKLIRQGAELVVSPQEMLRELKSGCVMGQTGEQQMIPVPVSVGERLLRLLDYEPVSMEILQQKYARTYNSPITVPEFCLEMLKLCADGLAGQISGNYYVRKG